MENFDLKFIRIRDVKCPVRGHDNDAGIDFFIPEDFEDIVLYPGEDILIPSGIKVIVPDGYALIFKEKSGVATKKRLSIGACVVDSGYRGEVHLHLFNTGNNEALLEPGDKITQALIVPISLCKPVEISEEEYDSYSAERGEGGFGSTRNKII